MAIVKFKNSSLNPIFPSIVDDFFIDDLFPSIGSQSRSFPSTNIEETDEAFILSMAIPGMTKEDIQVVVEDGRLSISAEKEDSSEEEGKSYTRKEYSYNSFERSFTLPKNVTGEIVAKYKDGILNVSLPKSEVETSNIKKIEVS